MARSEGQRAPRPTGSGHKPARPGAGDLLVYSSPSSPRALPQEPGSGRAAHHSRLATGQAEGRGREGGEREAPPCTHFPFPPAQAGCVEGGEAGAVFTDPSCKLPSRAGARELGGRKADSGSDTKSPSPGPPRSPSSLDPVGGPIEAPGAAGRRFQTPRAQGPGTGAPSYRKIGEKCPRPHPAPRRSPCPAFPICNYRHTSRPPDRQGQTHTFICK